jgi:hypothetical protein
VGVGTESYPDKGISISCHMLTVVAGKLTKLSWTWTLHGFRIRGPSQGAIEQEELLVLCKLEDDGRYAVCEH